MANKPSAKKKDAVWEKLAKELRTTIPKLDTEGLAFLVEQSRIHLYNMQVDELNKLKMRAANAASRSKIGSKTAEKTQSSKNANAGGLSIDPTGTGFYLRSNSGGTMFSKNEMVQLTKIAHGTENALEAGARLYAWFIRERIDVLTTLQIKDNRDKRLENLVLYIKKNFKLKK